MSQPTFAQFTATTRMTGFEPAPDGTAVYYIADTDGQFNLWRAPVAGGAPMQLTHFANESVRDLIVSADGRQIAFVADFTGNEMAQVYLLPTSGGAPRRITDQPGVHHSLGAFSPDNRYLAYSANATSPRDMDIYLYDLAAGETRQVTPGGRLMHLGTHAFSPDSRQILAVQFITNTDQNLWLIDVATGACRNMTEHEGRQVKHLPLCWQKEGQGFWFFSDEAREFMGVGFCDLPSGHREPILTADWDVEQYAVSARHALVASCINESGNSRLQVTDTATGLALPLPEMPKGVIRSLRFADHDRHRRLFLIMDCYNQPAAVYVIDLDRRTLRRLTPSAAESLPASAFVSPELVQIPSFDGQLIPAWLYRPHGMAAGIKVPAVLSIHGGPEIQERPDYRYNGFYQYLLSQGVAILAPNIRGSTGFGIHWQRQVHRDWGGRDLKDMEACAQYLQRLDWVESSRLAVWGRSYGGFAALSCALRLPQYWACAV
ncbi:MAG: S9 family peptidase, partial [Mycobacterium leprae]